MIKYNFTSDLRISVLRDSIAMAANNIANDTVSSLDKSGQNNTATLSFYFNLKKGTNTLALATQGDITQVIRNFVVKFQYPNPYTTDLLTSHIADNIVIAPLRNICKLLAVWSFLEDNQTQYLTYDEIRYFIFCDPQKWFNASIEVFKQTINLIKEARQAEKDFTSEVDLILDWKQYERQSRELINTITYASNCFKSSKGSLFFTMPNILNDNFGDEMKFISDIMNFNEYWVCNSDEIQNADKSYIKYMDIVGTINISNKQIISSLNQSNKSLQQILFGAPGTGKSHTINCDANITEQNSIRTTFHPDSDYSTFVGCYKPTKDEESGEITYDFTPQAFTNAYVAAWKNVESPFFLIIEEINRGNCAQIFGDIFQLLDRDPNGFSSYKTTPDQDLANYIREQFTDTDIDDADVKSGKKMQLPPNLYIWATMNTSDQSLFPIDSAFKRRWDWRYIPIDYTDKGHYIACGDTQYSWADFLQKVNDKVESVTQSEDKKLGYWFMGNGAEQKEITVDRFVSKVVFYLWNDVFKDFGKSGNTIFKDTFAKFHKFFDFGGNPKEDVVKAFLDALGVKSGQVEAGIPEAETPSNAIDYTKYSFDGEKKLSKKALGEKIVLKYLKQNPNLSFEQIRNIFTFDNSVETPYQYKGIIAKTEDITDERAYSAEQTSSDGVKYKILTWWNKYNVNFIIKFAEAQGWSITEEQK